MSKTSLACFLLLSIRSTIPSKSILIFFTFALELTLRFLAGAMFVDCVVRSRVHWRIGQRAYRKTDMWIAVCVARTRRDLNLNREILNVRQILHNFRILLNHMLAKFAARNTGSCQKISKTVCTLL